MRAFTRGEVPVAVSVVGAALAFGLGLAVSMVAAQTTDGETPPEEEACKKYEGEGARYGLCVAYCEAQDCADVKGESESCYRIRQQFNSYSVKKGYLVQPPGKRKVVSRGIDCRETECSPDDVYYCRGREADCDLDGDGTCDSFCSSTLEGFDENGKPLCSGFPLCGRKCVSEPLPPKEPVEAAPAQ